MNAFHDIFDCEQSIVKEFQLTNNELEGCEILLACYSYEDYSGSAIVIFKKDGKLYEVNGSHCSCNGLEGQWEPDETSWASLAMRGNYHFDNELRQLVSENMKESNK